MQTSDGKDYYVYTHRDEDGAVVYVGAGRDGRAWTTHAHYQPHARWIRAQTAARGPGRHVRIEDHALTRTQAAALEARMIGELAAGRRFNRP